VRELQRQKDRLDYLFIQVSRLPVDDDEIKAHWARYLCVLTSGYIENSIRIIFSDIAHKQASPSIANFVESRLRDFQNPRMEKIYDIIRQFNPSWEARVRSATFGEFKDSVDSIVANRHLIAHGQPVNITYVVVSRYYKNVTKVIEIIQNECK
jgi:hypothetical protein